ncbi:hypothetical protein WMF04_00995 [Sorangium sp. So ce260]|uniref:hypothetical protein n=1 Tax=Sorangium sp. So ce260 TaxID=3133291 RepID=UPI003F63F089
MSVRFGSIYHVACSVLVVASSALFVGCALESEVEVDDSELVDEAASAFTEAACATNTPNITATDTISCWDIETYTSANASYGTATCTNAHLVQMNGTYSASAYALPHYGNAADADTQAECNTITANLRRWRGGSPTDVAYHGSWNSAASHCFIVPNSGTDPGVANGDRFVVQMKKGASFIRVGVEVHGPEC